MRRKDTGFCTQGFTAVDLTFNEDLDFVLFIRFAEFGQVNRITISGFSGNLNLHAPLGAGIYVKELLLELFHAGECF